jgi:hypothetical protein
MTVASYSASAIPSGFIFYTNYLRNFTKAPIVAFGSMVATEPTSTAWAYGGGKEKLRGGKM